MQFAATLVHNTKARAAGLVTLLFFNLLSCSSFLAKFIDICLYNLLKDFVAIRLAIIFSCSHKYFAL